MSTDELTRLNMIENRADLAKSVLTMLLMALDSESRPVESEIDKTIAAAVELLTVSE